VQLAVPPLSRPAQVDGIERHAFILPREHILDSEGNETEVAVDMVNHVLPEFMQIARSKGIKRHQCKPTTRKYMYHFEVCPRLPRPRALPPRFLARNRVSPIPAMKHL
jgi:hypothetical protein